MAVVTITSLTYNTARDTLEMGCDFSALVAGGPTAIVVPVRALGNRIALGGYADGDAALTGIVLEHAARLAPDATGTTVDWQSPSDEEKASQLDAQADAIEAARVFFGGTP